MTDGDERFLARWSRRKRTDGDPGSDPGNTDEPAPELQEGAAPPAGPGGDPAVETDGDPEVIARLPDIETLEESSDFTAFMAAGVPEALRRRALRKLWRLNPVFANLDGLNDYDEDYTDAAMVIEGMKTIYKVGRGMLDDTPEAGAEGGTEPTEEVAADEGIPDDGIPDEGIPDEETVEAPPGPESTAPASPGVAALASDDPERIDREDRRDRVRGGVRESGRSAVQRRWGDSNG